MNTTLDRVFCGLLALGVLGHLYGTLTSYKMGTEVFTWSLAGVLAAALIVVINWLRSSRAGDKPIAWLALIGSLGWVVVALLFGQAIGNVFDPRVLVHALSAAGLAGFSTKSVLSFR
jgi:hypothetical protein